MRWALLALLAIAQGVLAQDRLKIEVVPVYVFPLGVISGNAGPENAISMSPGIHGSETLVAVHEAMIRLRVQHRHYDVVLSRHSTLGTDYLECTYAEPGVPSSCTQVTGSGPFTQEQINDLHRSLGHETLADEPTPRQPGTIRMLVVIKNESFPWDAGWVIGKSTITSWNGWDPDDMHWSTMACTAWAHLSVPTIAHELGHCFGLEHNGAGDPNFDGYDNTLDLMVAQGAVDQPVQLKVSNQIRVINHFGPKPEASSVSRAPTTRTFD